MIINETESPPFFQQNGHIVSVPRRVRKKVNVGVYSLARKEHCLARPLHVTSGETRTIHSFLNSLGSIAFDYYSLWAIARKDKVASLFIVILHRKYSPRCL